MSEQLQPQPADSYPPGATNRLLASWTLLMLSWPLNDVAAAHDWLAVLGLVVIFRVIASFLGISAVLALWRRGR